MKPAHHNISLAKSQRGALGLFGALVLLLSILFAALAVDSGRLMMEQRKLQSVADMAAMDAASVTGHCGSDDFNVIQTAAEASAGRNQFDVGGNQSLTIRTGTTQTNSAGVRQFTETAIEQASAVEVVAGKILPASIFAGGFFGNDANLNARAIAGRQALAGFMAGSALLSISDEQAGLLNDLFTGILGAPVDLGVLSYEGLAAAEVSFQELIDASASAGSASELLASELSMAEALQLYADALQASDVADVSARTAAEELAGLSVSGLSASFADVLNVTTENPEEAADADLNMLDLITTTALVANGSHSISLGPEINLLGLNVSTQLNVTEAPQMVVGPPGRDKDGNWQTFVETAQVDLTSQITGNVDLNVAGLVGAEANVDLALSTKVAQGRAWLKEIQCSRLNDNNAQVTIAAEPGTAALAMTQASDTMAPEGLIDVTAIVTLLRLPIAEVGVGLNAPIQNTSETDLIYIVDMLDNDALPQSQRASTETGLAVDNIPQNLSLDVELLGVINLGGLTTLLENALLNQILTPLIAELGRVLIDPLLDVLGIQVGNIEVQLFTVDIDRPELKI